MTIHQPADRAYRRGNFTFVEIMGATVVAAIIIAAAVALINVVQWGMVHTYRSSRAVSVADSRIAQLHAAHFIDLPMYEESEVRVNDQGVPSGDGQYLRTTLIGSEVRFSRQVSVEVSAPWKANMPNIEVNLTTVITNPDILKADP